MIRSATQEDQFLEVLENHKKLVYKIAHAYCQTVEDRKDLIQEIVLQLWKAFPNYDKNYALSTWIYRIVLNVSISFYRKEKTRERTYTGYQQELDIIQGADYVTDQRLKQLYAFIEQLKPLDKAIMILYLEGRSNKEIADIMGMSLTNISTKIHRIKHTLSANFESIKQ